MGGQGHIVLPIVTFIYLFFTLLVAFGGSTFALIGLLMAALSPFSMMKNCPGGTVDDAAAAVGLWIGIRGCIIAMVIMAVCELASVPGEQAKMARDGWNKAMFSIQEAFNDLWAEKARGCAGLGGRRSWQCCHFQQRRHSGASVRPLQVEGCVPDGGHWGGNQAPPGCPDHSGRLGG